MPPTTTTQLIARAEENSKWIGRNYKRLAKSYDNKWIAVLDTHVIDSDADMRSLISRLRKRLGVRYSEVSIEYVSKKPIDMVLV